MTPLQKRLRHHVTGAIERGEGTAITEKVWMWRMKNGHLVAPMDMTTKHLFNTVKMLWNNLAPAEHRIGKAKLYRFGPSYTPEYLREAAKNITAELAGRKDLTTQHLAMLVFMKSTLEELEKL